MDHVRLEVKIDVIYYVSDERFEVSLLIVLCMLLAIDWPLSEGWWVPRPLSVWSTGDCVLRVWSQLCRWHWAAVRRRRGLRTITLYWIKSLASLERVE